MDKKVFFTTVVLIIVATIFSTGITFAFIGYIPPKDELILAFWLWLSIVSFALGSGWILIKVLNHFDREK